MSTEDTERTTRDADSNRWSTGRRGLLRTVGVGLGGLALTGTGVTAATTATTDCAAGPEIRTYAGGTVNFGRIRAEEAGGTPPADAFAASTPPGADERVPGAAESARLAARETDDGDGPLSVRTEYDGVTAEDTRGGVPSDSQVAAGTGTVVHALNQQVAIYSAQSGEREQMVRLERIWEPVIDEPEGGFAFGIPFVFDPRARYDREADRYVICATQFEPGLTADGELVGREDLEEEVEGDGDFEATLARPPRGWFVVAVSATSNPNGEWHVYRIPPLENEGLVDYPTLGHDRDAVYLTQNFFGREFEVTLLALDKAAMYAGEDVTAAHFRRLQDPGEGAPFTFTVQPAQQPFSGGESGTFYLVNSGLRSDALTLWELTDPLSDPTLTCHTLDANVDPYAFPPAAEQPGTDALIDTIDTRLMNADYDDGSLWTAHAIRYDPDDGDPVAAIRWYEIDVESRSVVQQGTYGEPDRSYFLPTVGADDGRTVIVHNVSGPQTFVRMDVAGRRVGHEPGELEDAFVVEEGKSPYDYGEGFDVMRWGDYNGVSVDPASGRFWTVSQYSPDVDVPPEADERDPYYTRIAEVDFEG
ncbi:hypothetical protein [Salinilacihabitans rarus]|uniref:hypothetical protein n=1 Tax=Salinilacihabitans rarus TaxID=2961596 RepID=UPI0020C8BD6E|nr:hypothetical protein [Salinilacihabitans rarus]